MLFVKEQSVNVPLPSGAGLKLLLTNLGPDICFFEITNDPNYLTRIPTTTEGGGMPVMEKQALEISLSMDDSRLSVISQGMNTLCATRARVL